MIATLKRTRFVRGSAAKLEAAMTELSQLESKRREVEKFYSDAFALASSYEERANDAAEAYKAALSSRDLPAFKDALERLLQARVLLDLARIEQATLSGIKRGGTPFAVFLRDNPHSKQTLLAVCRGKLEQAEEKATAVLNQEKARLPEWDSDSVSHSPAIRAADAVKNRLMGLLSQIEGTLVITESIWLAGVGQLLE